MNPIDPDRANKREPLPSMKDLDEELHRRKNQKRLNGLPEGSIIPSFQDFLKTRNSLPRDYGANLKENPRHGSEYVGVNKRSYSNLATPYKGSYSYFVNGWMDFSIILVIFSLFFFYLLYMIEIIF